MDILCNICWFTKSYYRELPTIIYLTILLLYLMNIIYYVHLYVKCITALY